ncbi:ferrochelatase [Candidatus Pelagibacter communis]|uniref:ferrochelatase n=1 Tax=Pelagibacter ubique TaxID=198252 RepID=UPI00092D04B4|nr:ferrochelatase [Candidatus Pelagibacter ubique]
MMEKNHPLVKFGKTGVLIVNLGTPDSTSWFDVRKYLREFLSDRRVIEVNPVIWQTILNVFILNFRPSKTAKAYKEIWMKDKNMSPLLYYTKMQSEKISNSISKKNIIIDFAMRYGNPSIKSKIHKLHEMGCENLVILPLYPQYAAATTATVCDEVYRTLMKMRWQPSLKIIPHYESDPFYIDALVNSINRKLNEINWKPDLIIASYHGIPKKYFDKGDPYHCYCHKTTRLISEKFTSIEIKTTFQSRFGPQEWLQPYTDKTLDNLPKEGVKNVLTICPGFSSDCVETLEEILIQGKESFITAGGENFDMVPCLNDNNDHILLLKSLIERNI